MAVACPRGEGYFKPECRDAVFAYLSERNDAEWQLAQIMLWQGAPWWLFGGAWVFFTLPIKIIMLILNPELLPGKDFDYSSVTWDDFLTKFWYFDLGTDVLLMAPYVFIGS